MDAPHEETRWLIEESRSLERQGEIAAAIQQAQRARRLAQNRADLEGEAMALNALAYAHIRLGHYEQARQFCCQALKSAGAEAPARVDALLNWGICAGETDDLDALESSCTQAIDLSRQIGYPRALIRGLHMLACMVHMPRGQFVLALAIDEEALRIARAQGLPDLAWGPLLTMSYVHWLAGQPSLARARLEELRQAVSPGSLGDGYWHYIQANLALEAGDVEGARNLFARTLSIAEANGIAENLFLARLGMSRFYRVAGDASAALAWASEALAAMQRSGYQHLQAQALVERSRALWALGNPVDAESDLRAALTLLTPQRLDFDLAIATLLLAALLQQLGHSEAPSIWREASFRLVRGGFAFLADRERTIVAPLILQGLKSSEPAVAEASNNLLQHLQKVAPPPLRITTLGSWRVQAGHHWVDPQLLRQRRAGELLAFLLTCPGRCLPVDQAMETFWPEKDPASAQPLLYHATSTLRRALEPGLPEKFLCRYLRVEDGKITLLLPPDSQVDYEVFVSNVQHEDWDAALACYGGSFLPEYRYAAWAEVHRRWLAQEYQHALLMKAGIWLSGKQFQPVLQACHAILADEPWQEQAVLLAMRACMGLGNTAEALRLYRNLEKTLHNELGMTPQPELQAFYHSLRKRT
jgi:DNA-binding SARP family transcriptional activator/tetratricopeptide (TPR) repeat protein